MGDASLCPTPLILAEFAAGRLDEPNAQPVRAHLTTCRACAEFVARLQGSPGTTDTTSLLRPDPTDAEEATQAPDTLDESIFDFNHLEPSGSADALGQIGSYDILQIVGHGGMGVVFKARDRQLNRTVAIKVLARHLASSETARRRFLREARASAMINHPNVVTIHAVDEYRGLTFLVMEFVSGGSLRTHIKSQGKLKPLEVIALSAQIAAGLAAAHVQGVIHRDIKPANVMLEDRLGRVKITDFGLARIAVDNVELTSRNVAVGTPSYMAPEQVRGGAIDARADLFSLGCVIYAMLSGHSPFHGRHSLEVAHKVAEYDPPPLHESDPQIPRFLSDIVARLLCKDPGQRFQSAMEVADLLNQHLTVLNQTPTDKISTAMQRLGTVPPRPRPRRTWAYGLAALALALLGALFVAWRQPWNQPGRNETVDNGQPFVPAVASNDRIEGEITVSRSGTAQFRSLGEALKRAGPGARIRVLDDADYREPLVIDRREQWSGLTIEAVAHARLMAPEAQAIVRIVDTPHVKIKGFRMSVGTEQHGVEIAGRCEGCTLEDLHAVQSRHAQRATIILHSGASGSEQNPIVLRRLNITCGQIGVGLMAMGGEPIRHVRLEKNWFTVDPDAHEVGVFVILHRPVHEVTVKGNVFQRGRVGVSVLAPEAHKLSNVEIANNTFADVKHWLNVNESSLEQDRVAIHSNLILDSSALLWKPQVTEAALAAVAGQWFSDNWWEQRPTGNDELWQSVARFSGDPGVYRDPGQPRHLHPKPASPLVISAAGEAGNRRIIGALDPAEPGDGSPLNP